jgi:predicted amidohydrolase
MTRKVKIAAIQMDANPAPATERLARAARLVTEAAQASAQLVVLPELFNTGYAYAASNYRRAEPPDGPTATWLRETAARLNVHLAGSLMLLDRQEVYNALLVYAPDGRMWRYDKRYPWGWERAYFSEGRGITVADTDLGRIGMMVCWDAAHPELWRRYAGRVDLMLTSSCPPDVPNATYHLPDGSQVTMDQLGSVMTSLKDSARLVFGEMFNEQTAWLRVPAVNTVGTGQLELDVPNGTLLLLSMLPLAPRLIRYLVHGNRLWMSCGLVPGCKVVDATGRPLAELAQEQGEALALAEVSLPEKRPQPGGAQPPSRLFRLSYWMSDGLLYRLSVPGYRRGLRQTWGPDMAPFRTSTRQWVGVLGVAVLVAAVLGLIWRRRRPKG